MTKAFRYALPLLVVGAALAQTPQPLVKVWPALWIDVPATASQEFGVYHFRRTFELPARPEHFVVYVSGDNRYQLFANGKRVSWGPARGDLKHWRYETVDLGPELQAGKNVLAAVVWNDGELRAIAQITNRTGFVLQAELPENAAVNTSHEWKCIQDHAYSPQPIPPDQMTGYWAVAPEEHFDGASYPWNWEQPNFDDSGWPDAREISHAAPRDAQDGPNRWMLVPRLIPLEEQVRERLKEVREASGATVTATFLTGHAGLTVPAHTQASLLLDQSYLTTAYPELTVSGGQGAEIQLHYAETLYAQKGGHNVQPLKGNRNEVNGKYFYGPWDTFITDGGPHRPYRPLYWRTYRYLRLDVATKEQPLTIDDLHGVFTGYPFNRRAEFNVNDAHLNRELQQILSTGWRTARLCAHETYMDCPFYEQLQYAGDTRIQALISLYMTGDSRLMKNAIALLDSSRTSEGATYSRAPSYLQQYIPPFSLWWIGMVHDYWMYVDDPTFVRTMLPGVRAVLEFFGRYQKSDGSLAHMPWWNFVDWVKQWPGGVPPANADGSSAAALDLQLLMADRWAADLEQALGNQALGVEDAADSERLKKTILSTDWDAARGLFADQPEHRSYSQHVNTLAVLAGVIGPEKGRALMEKIIADSTLAQSTIYFRAYMNGALREVGLGDRYLDMLGPWREMLAQGLTTWAEWNGPDARSDCHAWGASPNFELIRTIAGVESMAPGFKRVRIAPNVGNLNEVTASMPHPNGEIRVRLSRLRGKLIADVSLPAHVTGEFEWAGTKRAIRAGDNHLEF
jgi:alpha-L-rhamnosidase